MRDLISVVIATYNRSESLAKVLEMFLAQVRDAAFDYELIVVDNNSKDSTKDTVASFAPRFEGRLQYIFEPKQGKSYALNQGIRVSRGAIIAFTDDDVLLDPMWLKEISMCFSKYACDGVGGRVLPIYPESTPQWVKENPSKISGGVVIYDQGADVVVHDPKRYPFIGANYAFRKEVFEDCGMFREDLVFSSRIALGEDLEFVRRLIKKGKRLYYCGKASLHHPVDLKRVQFATAARWAKALGNFDARMESEEKSDKMVLLFGLPRYLYRSIIVSVLRFPFSLGSDFTIFLWVRDFFRTLGMIQEYQRQLFRKQSG